MFASAIIIHIRGGRDEESAPGMAASVSAASVLPFSSLSTVPAGMRATTLLRATASLGPLDAAAPLRRAAKYTVDKYVNNGMVIGLGSGPASGLAIKYLGQQLRAGALEDIVGIATSVLSASEAAKAGIPLDDYQESSQINIAFDDADIIEEETLVAVIGQRRLQGGESIIQEKSILTAAKKLVFMITESKYRGTLEGSVPVLVQSLNWMDTAEEIDDLFLGDAEVWRRPSVGHADPLGGDYPLITKEGHNVLDVIFTSPITSLAEVAESLDKIDGVVDHGVISKFPCAAVIASDGGLQVVDNVAIKAFGNSAE